MIYDCFPFYNELDILELRLNILNDYVDKFVIVEGNKTYTGADKDFNFESNKSRYEKFLDKIIYIKVKDFPSLEDSQVSSDGNKWLYENYQRDAIMRGLINCNEDDVIIISDCDEIPNPTAIKKYKKGVCTLLQLRFFYYYNLLLKESTFSKAPKIARYCDLKNPKQKVKDRYLKFCLHSKYGLPTYLRFCFGKKIYNGGWHFTFIGDENTFLKKLESHVEPLFKNQKNNSEETIKKQISECINCCESSQLILKISDVFPKYFVENQEKYKNNICAKNQIPYWKALLIIYYIKIRKALKLY